MPNQSAQVADRPAAENTPAATDRSALLALRGIVAREPVRIRPSAGQDYPRLTGRL